MSHTSEGTTPWIRVLHIGSGSWLGLVDNALFVGDENGPKRQLDTDLPTGLLPCLERPLDAVLMDLRDRENELSMDPGTLTKIVPLAAVPAAALASSMDYWAALSLDWVTKLTFDESSKSLLLALKNAPWASQHTRHRARSIYRRSS